VNLSTFADLYALVQHVMIVCEVDFNDYFFAERF
jgi:hypothetical protein